MKKNSFQTVQSFVEEHMIDPVGIVYTQIDKTTCRPPTEETFRDTSLESMIEGYTQAEFWAYENCGMTTGAYMMALLVEPTPEHLILARRCFNALKWIYETGKHWEEGFFPKVYGKRFSRQTSTDQVLYAASALHRYYPYASKSEKADIAQMIPAMLRFWVNHRYILTYYNQKDMQWPLERFPALLALAQQYSDDPVFHSEYLRLVELTEIPACDLLYCKRAGTEPLSEYEKEHNAYLIAQYADRFTMQSMNELLLLEFDPVNPLCGHWENVLKSMWEDAKCTLAPDGKYYFRVLVDFDGKNPRPAGDDCPYPGRGAKQGWSTMIFRAALCSIDFLDRADVLRVCRSNQEKLSIQDLTYFDGEENFSPENRFKTRFLSGDAITNYLWSAALLEKLDPCQQNSYT